MTLHNQQITLGDQVYIESRLRPENAGEVVTQIYEGLTADQKNISSRFFYDSYGSELFEQITRLPEYYPSRTEISILKEITPTLASVITNQHIIELGSGDCSKISHLLNALSTSALENIRYIPVDISKSAIINSAKQLSDKYPALSIDGLHADFINHLTSLPGKSGRFICFFGSTIGNFTRQQATGFLQNLYKMSAPGDHFLLGLDTVKEKDVIEEAYNDKQGITAEFNRNILRVVNRYTKTDFDPDLFDHLAFYNHTHDRIEMHLVARRDMVVSSEIWERKIALKQGETIHTENSHKFRPEHIYQLARESGWKVADIFYDKSKWFSEVHFIHG